jgi:hypothetical protein
MRCATGLELGRAKLRDESGTGGRLGELLLTLLVWVDPNHDGCPGPK